MDNATPARYAPPRAVVGDVTTGVQPVRLWPPSGRIGRLRLFAYSMGIWLLSAMFSFALGMATSLSDASPVYVQIVSGLVYIALLAVLLIQRSHDMDLSGWWALLTLIPLVGLYWAFKSGTPTVNRFGAPPPPNSTGVVVVAWIGAGVVVLGIVGIVVAGLLPLLMLGGGAR